MKKAVLLTLGLLLFINMNAQDTSDQISIGDIMVINEPSGADFNHIHFPRKNFIIKRGGIADMKSVYGNYVMVTDIKVKKDGSTEVTLQRKNGRKFFRSFPTVKANLEKALADGELAIL